MLNAELVEHAFKIIEADITDGLRTGGDLKKGAQYEVKEINELFKALLQIKQELSLLNLDVLATKLKACQNQNISTFCYQEINIAIGTIHVELKKEDNISPKRKP